MCLFNFLSKILIKRRISSLKYFGTNISLPFDIKFSGNENISIDNNTFIGQGCWLACVPLTNNMNCSLSIGKNCSIGRFAHIFATSYICLEDNVLLAEKVYISDNLHSYDDIQVPIKDQCIIQKNRVTIGDGSWLGENVCVIGASIGRHSIIGANSVVTHDIPDFCVAVGAPAKVIKKYDFNNNLWVKV